MWWSYTYPIGSLKLVLVWMRYRESNLLLTIPLVDDLATAPLGFVSATVIYIFFLNFRNVRV